MRKILIAVVIAGVLLMATAVGASTMTKTHTTVKVTHPHKGLTVKTITKTITQTVNTGKTVYVNFPPECTQAYALWRTNIATNPLDHSLLDALTACYNAMYPLPG